MIQQISLGYLIKKEEIMEDPIKNTTKLPGEIRLIGYDSGVSSTTKKNIKRLLSIHIHEITT